MKPSVPFTPQLLQPFEMMFRVSPVVNQSCVLVLFVLTVYNVYRISRLIPNNELCEAHGMPWTPVNQGLKQTWGTFPDLTLPIGSKYFDMPIAGVESNWDALLPGQHAQHWCSSSSHITLKSPNINAQVELPPLIIVWPTARAINPIRSGLTLEPSQKAPSPYLNQDFVILR